MKIFVTKDRWILPDDIGSDVDMLYDALDKYDIAYSDEEEELGPQRAWEVYSMMEKGMAWEPVGSYSPEEVFDILKRYGVLLNDD